MRLPTVILAATLAVSLTYSSPAPALSNPQATLNYDDPVIQRLRTDIKNALSQRDCHGCIAGLFAFKALSTLNRKLALLTLNEICPALLKTEKDVCLGLTETQGPVILDSLEASNLAGGDAKALCYQLTGVCGPLPITSGTMEFPKSRPPDAVAPPASGNQIDVLHLSDWHYDPLYVPGSEAVCKKPTCCRDYKTDGNSKSTTPIRAASSWGDYACDTPMKLAKSLLGHVQEVAQPALAILTGDIPPHDIWLADEATVVPIEKESYDTMASILNTTVYPTVGNHEAGPVNLFPTERSKTSISWLYNSLADDWEKWLPSEAIESVRDYGAYNTSPRKGFRIISLNTNFCYRNNYYLYENWTTLYDPFHQLKWLVNQLQAAEDAKERVWIIGHVGPSQIDCIQNWSALYYQVVQRYSPHVIAEQFFGHTHRDDFALYYNSDQKTVKSAIATAWIGPSVTPFRNLNPGYRIYKVDTGSWNIFDSETYVADLSKAAIWDATGATPDWHFEYSARKAYGAHVPLADHEPLSASWWHNVTEAFEKNDDAFQQYWTYRGKSAKRIPECVKGSACPANIVCDLRAGKSSDMCSSRGFVTN